jgi:VanZ family protein
MKYLYLVPRFWKTILVLIIIYCLCLIPGNDIGKYEDLIVHTMMFLAFSTMLFLDLQRNTHLSKHRSSLTFMVLSFCILLGITTEILQFLLPSLQRTGSVTDFLFDMAGTALGITGMRLIKQ